MALEGWIQTQFCPTATGRCGSRMAAETSQEAPLALEDLPRPKAPKVKAAKATAKAPRQQPSKGIIARAGRVRLYQAGTVFWGKMRDSWWGLMLGNGQPSPGHCGGQQH